MQQTKAFHYATGEVVKKGDVIRTGNRDENGNLNIGVVELVIAPGTEDADAYCCPDEGGILIREDWGGTPSYLLETPPDGIYWEDLELIRRGD
jgi:hypothetical protein